MPISNFIQQLNEATYDFINKFLKDPEKYNTTWEIMELKQEPAITRHEGCYVMLTEDSIFNIGVDSDFMNYTIRFLEKNLIDENIDNVMIAWMQNLPERNNMKLAFLSFDKDNLVLAYSLKEFLINKFNPTSQVHVVYL